MIVIPFNNRWRQISGNLVGDPILLTQEGLQQEGSFNFQDLLNINYGQNGFVVSGGLDVLINGTMIPPGGYNLQVSDTIEAGDFNIMVLNVDDQFLSMSITRSPFKRTSLILSRFFSISGIVLIILGVLWFLSSKPIPPFI